MVVGHRPLLKLLWFCYERTPALDMSLHRKWRAPARVPDFHLHHSYNPSMARGWESKSVEMQIESAESSNYKNSQHDNSEMERLRRHQALVLSRSRVLQQLEVSQNPRHREMLQRALADLEKQLNGANNGDGDAS